MVVKEELTLQERVLEGIVVQLIVYGIYNLNAVMLRVSRRDPGCDMGQIRSARG